MYTQYLMVKKKLTVYEKAAGSHMMLRVIICNLTHTVIRRHTIPVKSLYDYVITI